MAEKAAEDLSQVRRSRMLVEEKQATLSGY